MILLYMHIIITLLHFRKLQSNIISRKLVVGTFFVCLLISVDSNSIIKIFGCKHSYKNFRKQLMEQLHCFVGCWRRGITLLTLHADSAQNLQIRCKKKIVQVSVSSSSDNNLYPLSRSCRLSQKQIFYWLN